MNERNVLCSSHPIHDLSNGQQNQNHLRSEPCIVMGSSSNFLPSHMNQGLPSSGNINNFDLYLPEHVGRPAFYGMTQYNQPCQPATNLELGIPTASNFYNLHLNPTSGSRAFPVPLNHGFVDQSPSSSNYRGYTIPFGEYGWSHSPEDARGLFKRKNAEGIPGNIQHFVTPAGPSSSSTAPTSSCHFDSGSATMDAPLALPPMSIGNGNPAMMEMGSGVTAMHRSGAVGLHMDPGMLHNYNCLPHGSYGNQSFPPSSCTWLNQQAMNNVGGFPWNGPPMLPYFQGSSMHGGSSELGNSGHPGYSEASSNHGSANFLHSPPILQQPHNLHPSSNLQGARGYGVACYPPFMAAAPSRVLTNDQHDTLAITPDSVEPPSRSTGIRIYRSHGRGILADGASRRRELPRLRTLPADRVAILEFPNLYQVDFEDFIDHRREMRLDIDDMSYEELLDLSERIGTVNTGVSENDITCHLRTRQYSSTTAAINLEELPCVDQNSNSCIICQDEYEDRDHLGILECGHEYHANCLKKWLLVKNVCPVCKASALTVDRKGR